MPATRRAAALRATALVVVWLALSGAAPKDLPVGIATAVAATWVSLRLLPAGVFRMSPSAIAAFALRFFRQSILAGIDVAWRALDPRLPLQPGFVIYRSSLAPGPARNAFCVLASLLPGTLPADTDESGALVIHCLDTSQPVAAQLNVDEELFVRASGGGRGHD